MDKRLRQWLQNSGLPFLASKALNGTKTMSGSGADRESVIIPLRGSFLKGISVIVSVRLAIL